MRPLNFRAPSSEAAGCSRSCRPAGVHSSGHLHSRGPTTQLRLVCKSQQSSDAFKNGDGAPVPERQTPEADLMLPRIDMDMDWRQVRAQLVARSRSSTSSTSSSSSSSQPGRPDGRWAHEISVPETGCLLLAHPLMFQQQQEYFRQGVILVLDHSDANGSWGIILNRPTLYKVKHVQSLYKAMPEFADCVLHMGGDVGESQLQLLHTHKLEGAKEIVKGVYHGGHAAATECIRAKKLDPDGFRLFVNYAGWRPRQLELECKMGVWFLAAASPQMIVELLEMRDHQQQAWHTVLELMGGSYRTLSDRIKQQRSQPIRHSAAGNTATEVQSSTVQSAGEDARSTEEAQARKFSDSDA